MANIFFRISFLVFPAFFLFRFCFVFFSQILLFVSDCFHHEKASENVPFMSKDIKKTVEFYPQNFEQYCEEKIYVRLNKIV